MAFDHLFVFYERIVVVFLYFQVVSEDLVFKAADFHSELKKSLATLHSVP
jgi:hypothetical protein